MSTEQKFKQLLDIAVKNGFDYDKENIPYNFKYLLLNDFEIVDNGIVLMVEGWSENREFKSSFSLHDLVLNTNFFECLFRVTAGYVFTNFNYAIYKGNTKTFEVDKRIYLNQALKFQWVLEVEKGTALEWLFKQFDI
jgi:hypothetical protein